MSTTVKRVFHYRACNLLEGAHGAVSARANRRPLAPERRGDARRVSTFVHLTQVEVGVGEKILGTVPSEHIRVAITAL